MSVVQDVEALKVKTFYVAFLATCGFGFWLATPNGAIPSGPAEHAANSSRRAPSTDSTVEEAPPLPTIRTLAELDGAFAMDRCAIFISVDWSLDAILGLQRIVYPLVHDWNARRELPNVAFFVVDLTEQKGPIFDKLFASSLRDVVVGGSGTLIVLRRGAVVDLVPRAASETRPHSRERIRHAFTQ